MSEFSNLLARHIVMSGFSISELARITGFSKGYVIKIKQGQRVPQNIEKSIRLFDALQLTPAEYRDLWDAYTVERLGRERYDLNQSALDFIGSFRYHPPLLADMSVQYKIPDNRVLYSEENIGYMLRMILEQEALKDNGNICIMMQPDHGHILDVLKTVFWMNPGCQVTHLIGLEKSMEDVTKKNHNIKLFQQLVPVILCQHGGNYQVYYYYEKLDSHFTNFTLMPNMVITSEYVMLMDYALKNAMIYRKNSEEDRYDFYEKQFDGMIRGCRQLYQYVDGEQMSDYYSIRFFSGLDAAVYTMGNQPCFGALDYERLQLEKQKVISYFTKSGIEDFLSRGRVEELPDEWYRSLEQKDCKKLLLGLIQLAEQGKYIPCLIDERKFQYPPGLVFRVFDMNRIMIYYNEEESGKQIIITEKSMARLMHEFLTGFQNSEYVYSQEKTIEYLKELAEEK